MFRRKLIFGYAVAALAAWPAHSEAQSGKVSPASRQVPIYRSQDDGTLRPDDGTASYPDWNTESEPPVNARLAEKLRAARHITPALPVDTTENLNQPAPEEVAPQQNPMPMQHDSGYAAEGTWDMHGGAMGGCSTGGCSTGGCDTCCQMPCCCSNPFWAHRTGFFGDYINFNPRGVDLAYGAQAITDGGPIATPGNPTFGNVPFGRVGVLDPEGESGYRAGFTWAMDSCSSVTATYTEFESDERDVLGIPGNTDDLGAQAISFVTHPGTSIFGAVGGQLLLNGYDIDFRNLDIDYSRLAWASCNAYVNWTAGVRYGSLEQHFGQVIQPINPGGVVGTFTDVNFDGVGLRLGADGRRRIGCGGWSVYGKSFINVLFGEFRSRYTQFNTVGGADNQGLGIEATANWEDDRVVPVLEYELGISWASRSERLRFSAGYYTAFWFNTITTGEFINAVQQSNYLNVGDTMSFDGLTTRVEYRF